MGKTARRRRLIPVVDGLEGRRLLSGYAPALVRAAYGFDGIAFATPTGAAVAGDGAGQTIAIVAAYHNPNLIPDLRVFEQAHGLPAADVTVVSFAGDATDATWAAESAMDVQWVHALAPAASIVLVEARSDSGDDVLAAVDAARRYPGATVVSMSFGFAETPGQHAHDALFTAPPGHAGITFVAAAGDHGQAGGAMYPASSPNVLGVGGTSLVLGAGGEVLSESAWSGSAGGQARYAARPSYQAASLPGARRNTPDVAFLGDPATGVAVYHTPPGSSRGSWRVSAGTSLGAPAWAAIAAIANQGRALAGKGSLDGPAEALPALHALAGTAAFRGVAGGSPTAVGLGVPDAAKVVPALVDAAPLIATTPAARTAGRAPIRRPPSFRKPSPKVAPRFAPRAARTPLGVGPARSLRPTPGTARVDFR